MLNFMSEYYAIVVFRAWPIADSKEMRPKGGEIVPVLVAKNRKRSLSIPAGFC